MNGQEARRVLVLYRPDSGDEADPQIAAALEMVRRDPELRQWFEEHCAFQEAMRRKLGGIPVPANLKDSILREQKVIHVVPWWRTPAWAAAAAVLVALVTLTILLLRPARPDRFADYRERMVGTALREYRMDIVTNDMAQVRQFMRTRGAPADYELTPGLEKLTLTGGGLLKWRGHPVSMVCFDRGDTQMLFLFVLERRAVKDPPPPTPLITRVNKLITASWSSGDQSYVLAGPTEPGFQRRYL